MICPTCSGKLSSVIIENIELDVCKEGCGGIWFDRFELQKMDEPHEFTDENLIDLLSVESPAKFDQSHRYNCPKCKDVVMMRHFWSTKKAVEIDHCPKCAGYWLDEGELFRIRNEYGSEGERKQAAETYYSSLFDGDLMQMKQESREKAEQARKIANMFRLISPRNYFAKIKDWK
ncbi:MAG: zf-TFIIB domain-containing protein [Desulfobacter sp.]|nr:MAG: zf-TFIIB domain-containing protein [Desulfobacter sp.]